MDDRTPDAGKDQPWLPYAPLPGDLTDARGRAGGVFDDVAELYDAARPGYPWEAIADLAGRCRLDASSRVLEVGCGTGQATRGLALSGAAINCLEPGRALADLARRNLASAKNVSVVSSTFEDFDAESRSYDLVVSATAFHWVDPVVSFAKSARLLRPGGSLALMTNAHVRGGTDSESTFDEEVRELHRQLAPEIGPWRFPTVEEVRRRATAGGDLAAVWSRVERKLDEPPSVAELFDAPIVSTYPWSVRYDRREYLAMLASQSSYALLEPRKRAGLLEAIGRQVDGLLCGSVIKQYLTILATARKPGAEA
jgi:SAM-dependent methyltransferase